MPWRCPACELQIHHHDFEERPRTGTRYRCHICRMELVLDPETNTLAPILFNVPLNASHPEIDSVTAVASERRRARHDDAHTRAERLQELVEEFRTRSDSRIDAHGEASKQIAERSRHARSIAQRIQRIDRLSTRVVRAAKATLGPSKRPVKKKA